MTSYVTSYDQRYGPLLVFASKNASTPAGVNSLCQEIDTDLHEDHKDRGQEDQEDIERPAVIEPWVCQPITSMVYIFNIFTLL